MMIPQLQSNSLNLFPLSIIVTEKNSKPALELRSLTTDFDIIKVIISCAYHNRPVVVNPTFRDPIKALGCLVDKGILVRDKESGQYCFTF